MVTVDAIGQIGRERLEAPPRASVPDRGDLAIAQFAVEWLSAPAEERARVVTALRPEHQAALLGFTSRMARLAFNRNEPTWLVLGGIAFAIQDGTIDDRDALGTLAVYTRAAEELRVDPAALFATVLRLTGGRARATLEGFLRRPPAQRDPAAFGGSLQIVNGHLDLTPSPEDQAMLASLRNMLASMGIDT